MPDVSIMTTSPGTRITVPDMRRFKRLIFIEGVVLLGAIVISVVSSVPWMWTLLLGLFALEDFFIWRMNRSNYELFASLAALRAALSRYSAELVLESIPDMSNMADLVDSRMRELGGGSAEMLRIEWDRARALYEDADRARLGMSDIPDGLRIEDYLAMADRFKQIGYMAFGAVTALQGVSRQL